jgi:hypothetical protein
MTPKERVLKRYPQAHCEDETTHQLNPVMKTVPAWRVYLYPFGPMAVRAIGVGDTPRQAWADAARSTGVWNGK